MGLFLKTGPFKSFILQPSKNANFLGPRGCKMKDLNGSRFLRIFNAKSGFIFTINKMMLAFFLLNRLS